MAANPDSLRISDVPSRARTVAFARGDGIGPEITDAVLTVMEAAGARLDLQEVPLGRGVYESGTRSGVDPAAWDILRGSRAFLKAPVSTPQGGGFKSVNVTMRKSLGLFANVRPCRSYHPFVASRHPSMDVVIVRENEEDTYAGIEHRATAEVVQCLKLVSRPGCERVIRYAFNYARDRGRRKVSCLTKDNIMKLTDGLFHEVFDEVAAGYPDLLAEHHIVDAGAARLTTRPEKFDVIVTPNLYGDILSDVAAEISGSIGLAASANVGDEFAMFEAVHGSAPDIAGRDLANPSGLLLAGVMMLGHVGLAEEASRVHNAWLRVLERGLHTADIFQHGVSSRRVGTREFARAIVAELGSAPRRLQAVQYGPTRTGVRRPAHSRPPRRPRKDLVGIDVFLDWDEDGRDPVALAGRLASAGSPALELRMITNRGVKVWPAGLPETFRTDHWRCRFLRRDPGRPLRHAELQSLLAAISGAGLDYVKTEHLHEFDGVPGYSSGQGE